MDIKNLINSESVDQRRPSKIVDLINESPKVLDTILKTKKKGIYKCSHCSTHFANFLKLAEHYDEFNIRKEFHCPEEECPWHVLGLPNKNELTRHIKSQHRPRLFACRMGCESKFHRADTRNRHEKQVHLNINSRLNKSQRNKKLKDRSNSLESYTPSAQLQSPIIIHRSSSMPLIAYPPPVQWPVPFQLPYNLPPNETIIHHPNFILHQHTPSPPNHQHPL